MRPLKKKNSKSMYKTNNITLLLSFLFISSIAISQVPEEIPDTQIEPPQPELQADMGIKKDSTPKFKKLKLDGIASVVGDYVILESDIEKTLIDLKSQGANTADITRCGLLGKLMEDRLYAHQAVQDSLLVSDDEVSLTTERQIQSFVAQMGSMDKLLKFYKKESEASLREDINKINKLRLLSEKMQGSIVSEIEITPEEVRQFFQEDS